MNQQSSAPQADALTRLSHTPMKVTGQNRRERPPYCLFSERTGSFAVRALLGAAREPIRRPARSLCQRPRWESNPLHYTQALLLGNALP